MRSGFCGGPLAFPSAESSPSWVATRSGSCQTLLVSANPSAVAGATENRRRYMHSTRQARIELKWPVFR